MKTIRSLDRSKTPRRPRVSWKLVQFGFVLAILLAQMLLWMTYGDKGVIEGATSTPSLVQRQDMVVDIISIGSLQRNDLQQAQLKTFGSLKSVRNFYVINERNDTEASCHDKVDGPKLIQIARWHCSKFGRRSHGIHHMRFPYLFLLTFSYHGYDKIKTKGRGWLCAQKRPIDALYQVLTTLTTNNLPDYLLVIDDDTWLHLPILLDLLTAQHPSHQSHLAVGCLIDYWDLVPGMESNGTIVVPQMLPFRQAFPVGGLGSFWSRGLLENLMQPIHCDTYEKTEGATASLSDAQADVCQQLAANLIGEGDVFRDGMSILDLMYHYTFDQTYTDVFEWNDVGFCLHSDMVLGFFVQFYGVASDSYVGLDESSWHTERRLDPVKKKTNKFSNKTNFCLQSAERHCTDRTAICHYMSAARMLELGKLL